MNVLTPVSFSRTNEAAIAAAVDHLMAADTGGELHLVYTETSRRSGRHDDRIEGVLRRSAAIAKRRSDGRIAVSTAHLARDRYLASPHDHAATLADYARANGVDLLVIDPNYTVDATDPSLQPLRHAFERVGLRYQLAAVGPIRRPAVTEVIRGISVAAMAFVFYLVVAMPLTGFGFVTGIAGAVLTGVLFRNVAFETTPVLAHVVGVFARGLVFVPYLLGKIAIANVQISYLVLHPSLPIDVHLDRVESGLTGGVTVTALANSLTLTPGTLTVDAVGDELLVHSITAGSRREVVTGARTRGIQFVYLGREGVEPADAIDVSRVETVAGRTDVRELARGVDEP